LAGRKASSKCLVDELGQWELETVTSGAQLFQGISFGRGGGDVDDELWGIGKRQIALDVVSQLDPTAFVPGERRALRDESLRDSGVLRVTVLPNDQMMALDVCRQKPS
jgi:hypothetical protein